MASALAGGAVRAGVVTPEQICAFDPDPRAAETFTGATGAVCANTDAAKLASGADVTVLAVKPQMLEKALAGFGNTLENKLVVSIAAGVPVKRLRELTGAARIIRVMPNTPALVGEGAAAYACEGTAEDDAFAAELLGAVGMVTRVDEALLDTVTGLSGSGPAYVFEFIRALADGGVADGLSREAALQLAAQTVLGAAKMVLESGEHPSVLKDRVTSPGGTTSRGLEYLADRAFAGIVTQAVRAATARSRELGAGGSRK